MWRLLLDARTWPAWSPLDELVVERSSGIRDDGTRGVGAVQAFRTGANVDGERITELVADRRMTYEAAFNQTMIGYRAAIDLTPVGGGTHVRWHGTYDLPGGVPATAAGQIAAFMQRMVDGVAAHAGPVAAPPAGVS